MSAPFRIAPAIGYILIKEGDTRQPTNLVVFHGQQPATGRYLSKLDLETYTPGHHTPGQNAQAAWAAFSERYPAIAAKMDVRPSTHGGIHAYYLTNGPMPHGKLYDPEGRHVGDHLADDTAVSILPEGLAPGWLSKTERDILLSYWRVDTPAEGGERWSDRAAEGLRYAAGYTRHRVTLQQLRTFLQQQAGPVGDQLARLLDERRPFDRSNATGHLAQCLMLHIHKIAPAAGFAERCALAMAYLMAAESYGKASEKDYNQEKDCASLIAQIVNGDAYGPRDNPRRWTIPFWTKAHTTPTPAAPEPTPDPTSAPRPAHRPAGHQARMIAKLRRYLELRAFETDGKLYYSADDLAELLGVARRTAQNYLQELKKAGLITCGQDAGPGGRAWLIWCANNSDETAPAAAELAPIWYANECATMGIETPETADQPSVCKEDHQDLSAPALASLESRVERDAAALAAVWAAAGPPRPRRRAARQSRFTGRDRQQLAPAFAQRPAGLAPTPTPYREKHRLVEETLPELRPAAPAGAPSSGDLPTALGLIQRLKALRGGSYATAKAAAAAPGDERQAALRPVQTAARGSP